VSIKSNGSYFRDLQDVDIIYVLGHSISEVDISYFQKIKDSIGSHAQWNVSYYSAESVPLLRNALTSIGVNNINFFQLSEILVNNRQFKLGL